MPFGSKCSFLLQYPKKKMRAVPLKVSSISGMPEGAFYGVSVTTHLLAEVFVKWFKHYFSILIKTALLESNSH